MQCKSIDCLQVPSISKQTPEQVDAFPWIDNKIISQVEKGPFYKNFQVTDKSMGIDDSGAFKACFPLYPLLLNSRFNFTCNSQTTMSKERGASKFVLSVG